MNGQNLKQMISEDINVLKTLDLDIMPAGDYYKANLRLFLTVFLRMYLTVAGAAVISIFLHWSSFFSDKWNGLWEMLLTFGGSFLLTGFIFLFIYETLNNYVIFDYQIRSKLQSGALIDKQIKRAGWVAYTIFAVVVVVPTIVFHPMAVLIAEFVAFFASGIFTGIIIEMEMKRVGISTLFTLIRGYFDKSKDEIQQAKGL